MVNKNPVGNVTCTCEPAEGRVNVQMPCLMFFSYFVLVDVGYASGIGKCKLFARPHVVM